MRATKSVAPGRRTTMTRPREHEGTKARRPLERNCGAGPCNKEWDLCSAAYACLAASAASIRPCSLLSQAAPWGYALCAALRAFLFSRSRKRQLVPEVPYAREH